MKVRNIFSAFGRLTISSGLMTSMPGLDVLWSIQSPIRKR